MGLLDSFMPTDDPVQRNALLTGLLSAGFGAMTGKAGQPLNTIGRAGLLGLTGYGAAQTLGQNQKDAAARLEEQKTTGLLTRANLQSQIAEREQKLARERAIQGLIGQAQGPQIEMQGPQRNGFALDPVQMPAGPFDIARLLASKGYTDEAAKQAEIGAKLAPKTHVIGERLYAEDPSGGPLVDRGGPGRQIDYNKAFLPDGTPNRPFQDYDLRRAREGKTTVDVKYGAPVAGVDARGNPIFFQPDPRGGNPSVIPGVSPPPKENKPSEAYTKQQTGIEGVKSAIEDYRKTLENWNTVDTLSPAKRAEMGTVYNNMMLQAKEAYNLGVLNGPDYAILTSVVTDPTSVKGAITPNASMDAQAKKLSELMTRLGAVSDKTHGQNQGRRAADKNPQLDLAAAADAELARRAAARGGR